MRGLERGGSGNKWCAGVCLGQAGAVGGWWGCLGRG